MARREVEQYETEPCETEQLEIGQYWEAAEFLDIKPDLFLREIRERLDVYNILLQIDDGQMKKLFNDALIVDAVETEAPEVTKGWVYIQRDGTGKYYALKNLYFCLFDFFEGVFNLVQADSKYRIVIGALFLFRMMREIGVELEEEQAAVCVALYQMAKRYALTDENITSRIIQGLKECDYIGLNENQVKIRLSQLVEMGIVAIEDGGRYKVTEILWFQK